jgi:hypothetical protein
VTPEQRESIEGRHHPLSAEFGVDCAHDGETWPCDAHALLAALAEAEQRAEAAEREVARLKDAIRNPITLDSAARGPRP